MRELTKSMMSYGWATSLFGMQQVLNVFSPWRTGQEGSATKGFNNASSAMIDELHPSMREIYGAGESFQRTMINMFFDFQDPNRWLAMSRQMMDQAAVGGRRMAEGGAEAMWQGLSSMGNPPAGGPGPAGS